MSDRNDIKKTPGKITLHAAGTPVDLYSSDGITAELQDELVMLSNPRSGEFDERAVGRMVMVKLKPTQFTAAALAKIFTHGSTVKGASLLASTDKTLDIHTIDGKRRRIPCAYVHGEPAMTCSTGKTILGEVTFYGILPIGGDPASLANYWSLSSVAWPGDASWDLDNELTPGWEFAWSTGSATKWDAIDTRGGVTITPRSGIDEDKVDGKGLINASINSYVVEAQAEVLNISEDLVLAAMGWSLPLGSSRSQLGRDLALNAVGGGAYIRLYNAVMQTNQVALNFAANKTVTGQLNWKTRPTFTSGLANSSFLISTTDPDA